MKSKAELKEIAANGSHEEFIQALIENVTKETIKAATHKDVNGRNSMGVSESYYDPDYLISTCFGADEIDQMSDANIRLLARLAFHSADVFY